MDAIQLLERSDDRDAFKQSKVGSVLRPDEGWKLHVGSAINQRSTRIVGIEICSQHLPRKHDQTGVVTFELEDEPWRPVRSLDVADELACRDTGKRNEAECAADRHGFVHSK